MMTHDEKITVGLADRLEMTREACLDLLLALADEPATDLMIGNATTRGTLTYVTAKAAAIVTKHREVARALEGQRVQCEAKQ